MTIDLPTTSYIPKRVFCIGRNYKAHIEELNSKMPTSPVIFLKPSTSLVPVGRSIVIPSFGKNLHFETELVILIGAEGKPTCIEDTKRFVEGVSLGLDLTMRDVQNKLKDKGLPWEKSKAFDGSAPLGSFVLAEDLDLSNISFTCHVNGELKQNGNSSKMIFDISTLIMELSTIWSFKPGDLIFTGTPEGVGPLVSGDKIKISSKVIGTFAWTVK